jgi:hypothetical protein
LLKFSLKFNFSQLNFWRFFALFLRMEEYKQVKNFKPEYIAQLCPRCKGYKSVSYGKIPCDMCNQQGYIKIPVTDGDIDDEKYEN